MPALVNLVLGAVGTYPITTFIIAALAAVYVVLYQLQKTKDNVSEPPIIPSKIPFLGHVLGMLFHGGRYVKNIGLQNPNLPIFTLPIPFSRMYIVTDPSLASTVQRASKQLSFTPLVPDITKRVLGLDSSTVSIVRQKIDHATPGEEKGFLADMHDFVATSFGPGDTLESLSLVAARELVRQVSLFAAEEEVDLLDWIRHFVTIATANFFYGPLNPFPSEPELEQAFWDFDSGLGSLLALGPLARLFAPRALYGREKLVKAFQKYLSPPSALQKADPLVQKRVAIALHHGWTLKETARSDVSFLFAGIVNTATTAFWVVVHLFAEPKLLEEIREELLSSSVSTVDGKAEEGREMLRLDLKKLKENNNTPKLHALLKECLRSNSDTYSTRLVVPTTPVFLNEYYLRPGSIVQISGGTMHASPAIWGEDVSLFKADRFLSTQTPTTDNNSRKKETQKQHPGFRAFGGGKTLCPGRHFATAEILALVAIIAIKFDISSCDEERIKIPEKEDGVMPVHVLEPKTRVKVRVRVRDGREVRVV
ncbi:cholesterol 7-alpha-monooxygenase [Podospora australis]|uniref:Cholesterol 7-alpha-monooxygenase n=1 Tax=Podospora australis TaxID=1536484 RepID=A0AAN7AKI0_9PEZI|nr:cholesterol 7-alpha-monooxygenase [Podospora australis]